MAITTSSHHLPIHRKGVSLQEKYVAEQQHKGSALDVETKNSIDQPKDTDFIWNRVWGSSSLRALSKTMEILVVSNVEEADSSMMEQVEQ